jgi:hypothetical protein
MDPNIWRKLIIQLLQKGNIIKTLDYIKSNVFIFYFKYTIVGNISP